MDHKNLQKIVQPQVPKIKPPKKIKDIEGLGAQIPIQNIGAIAGNIAGAALTGGATAAGEALFMGGNDLFEILVLLVMVVCLILGLLVLLHLW